jgi:RNA polymerase sigma-70 factor (ECF subfamily)
MKPAGPEWDESTWDELIRRSRRGDAEAFGRLLEAYRGRLRTLAERKLRGPVAARVDASDVVQQTFLEAHQCFGQFLGHKEPELVAWLETILRHTVAKTIRDTLLQKRDVRRERPLQAVFPVDPEAEPQLDAGQSTPSYVAKRNEDADRLVRALQALPRDQQEAVKLRHLEGRSLADIARHLGRTEAATAGLIRRGLQALRKRLPRTDH